MAGVAVVKRTGDGTKGYSSNMPQTKSKKMMYSSVNDEDRRRANQVKEERDNLEYQQFTGNDVTATMNDDNIVTLGATQEMPFRDLSQAELDFKKIDKMNLKKESDGRIDKNEIRAHLRGL